jgi:23S rRNA (cytidine1920-2'-O)/16S rRNA (cytidine1409-2'-O)-methyltransferase
MADPLRNKGDSKVRLDHLLVGRRLAASREQAQRLILAGVVAVDGARGLKPGARVPASALVAVDAPERFVSRGGHKLEAALDRFGVRADGRVCADIGASTGGFTDCLLQRGAARVYAVDVGRTQLHERLRAEPRVIVMDHTNARELHAGSFPEPPELLVADLSFISLTKVLAALAAVAPRGAVLVALVKPQFEVGRADASRGRGVIRDPRLHARALRAVAAGAAEAGWAVHGVMPSPLPGGSGNREFLVHLLRGGAPPEGFGIDHAVEQACMDAPPAGAVRPDSPRGNSL